MPQNLRRPALVVSLAALEDASWLTQWEKALLPLQQAEHLTLWSAHHIPSGDSLQEQFDTHLNQAACIFLLLSADFFASDQCVAQMERALSRQRTGQVRVVPLLLLCRNNNALYRTIIF